MIEISRVELHIKHKITKDTIIKMKSNISKIYYHFSLHTGSSNKIYPKLQDVAQITNILNDMDIDFDIVYTEEQEEYLSNNVEGADES